MNNHHAAFWSASPSLQESRYSPWTNYVLQSLLYSWSVTLKLKTKNVEVSPTCWSLQGRGEQASLRLVTDMYHSGLPNLL